MYIEQARNKNNPFRLYVIGVVVVSIVVVLGGLPFDFALIDSLGMQRAVELTIVERMKVLPANTTLFLLLFPFSLVFGTVLLLAKLLHKQTLRELITSRLKLDWSRIGFSFGAVVVISVIMLLISYFLNPDTLLWNFDPKAFAVLFVVSIVMVPLQTSAEELFFRGYLMQGLGRIFPKRIFPFIITSTLFGLLHFANPEVDKLGDVILITYLSTGFFLGAITLIDEGLELALGFHAGNNLFLSLFLTSDWTVFQTDSLFLDVSEPKVLVYVIAPLVAYSTLFIIFARKYQWKNYKKHLIGAANRPA